MTSDHGACGEREEGNRGVSMSGADPPYIRFFQPSQEPLSASRFPWVFPHWPLCPGLPVFPAPSNLPCICHLRADGRRVVA